jgi:hypothetical protein
LTDPVILAHHDGMDAWTDYTDSLEELHEALDEALLVPGLRDRIDNALAAVIRAARRDVLDHLVIGIENPETGLDTYIHRPLA